MPLYRVSWQIDIEADSPTEAAEGALAVQRDPESIATVFFVRLGMAHDVIDLSDGDRE